MKQAGQPGQPRFCESVNDNVRRVTEADVTMDSIEFWTDRRRRQREAKRRRAVAIVAWLFCVILTGTGAGIGLFCYFKVQNVDGVEIAPAVLKAVGYAVVGGIIGLTPLSFIRLGFDRLTMEEVPGVIPRNPWRPASLVGYVGAVLLVALTSVEQANQFDWGVFGTVLAGALLGLALGWAITYIFVCKLRTPTEP